MNAILKYAAYIPHSESKGYYAAFDKLLEIVEDNTISLPNAVQNIGSGSESAKRMRKMRSKKEQESVTL